MSISDSSHDRLGLGRDRTRARGIPGEGPDAGTGPPPADDRLHAFIAAAIAAAPELSAAQIDVINELFRHAAVELDSPAAGAGSSSRHRKGTSTGGPADERDQCSENPGRGPVL